MHYLKYILKSYMNVLKLICNLFRSTVVDNIIYFSATSTYTIILLVVITIISA